MELGLRLGEPPATPPSEKAAGNPTMGLGLGFCMHMGLGVGREEDDQPLQLNLLPLAPAPRLGFPWTSEGMNGGFDVNRIPAAEADEGSSGSGGGGGEREAAASRASDEEENGMMGRKKLRLSKEQSAFLEESFKEQNNLNPKQKLALAKQLNLRPRQVEVWFQNRRARTKLKQTEVDCDYLKRCCETLTEENRRLHKELAELRALKTAYPLYAQLPATTLSMCPSCERVSSAAAGPNTAPAAADLQKKKHASFAALFAKPRLFPFAPYSAAPPHQPSAAS